MGKSYQTILAVADVTEADGAVVLPVADGRWAIIPQPDPETDYAETDELSRRAGHAIAFDVFDSEVLVARVYRGGRPDHEYLSDQAWVAEVDGIQVDYLGREYRADEEPPDGPYGADPAEFVEFGVGKVDEEALFDALRGPFADAGEQHRAILKALGFDNPAKLLMTYGEASAT